MKKWLIRILAAVGLLVAVVVGLGFYSELDEAKVVRYTSKKGLETVREGFWGVPVDQHGRFVNVEHPFLPSLAGLLRWRLSSNPQAEEKAGAKSPLEVLDPGSFLSGDGDGIFWMGHASVMIRAGGKVILLDPVFGDPDYIDRWFELPSPVEKMKRVDYVTITHDHRDHMDEATIRALAEKFPEAKFLAGIGSEGLLIDWTSRPENVRTAGWYQRFDIDDQDVKITFVPVRHWSRRGPFDTNERLWGGFVIEAGGKKFYHGGDSGYGSHYKELAETFGGIDYFIIGIGSYAPRWFMKPNHNTPEEVWQAFRDSGAKYLVPMHYATFDMTDEPPDEPLKRLIAAAEKDGGSEKVVPVDIYGIAPVGAEGP